MTNKHLHSKRGSYFNKIKNILLTDVKKFNIYLLLIVSLLIIGSFGYTSYSLFSYEHSESIYVSFKDTEKPVCVIGEPAVSLMEKSSTTTFEMNCTDNYTVADKELTTSNFTKTGDITVTSVTKEKVGKAMKYIITVTSGTTGGVASIKLNAGAVTDVTGNSNLVSDTSEVFVKVSCDAMSEDVSGANSPEVSLASNMIPVCYNSTLKLWVKADSTNIRTDYRWYSYSDKKWANAVTVTTENGNAMTGSRDDLIEADVGTPIPMERINTMWVWIPRFSAVGDTANYNGGTVSAPGAFDITFVNKETTAHDAFTFGEQNLSGLWVGKFENSGGRECTPENSSPFNSGCNLSNNTIKIIPNVTSWRGAMVSTIYYSISIMTSSYNQYGFDKRIDTDIDIHMAKNNEWGAVAYLSQSIYGRCSSSTSCTKITINGKYITGNGLSYSYETTQGMKASTTGNIYGVYDMYGGAFEYVMGVYWDGTKYWAGGTEEKNSSGFNGCFGKNCSSILQTGRQYPDDNKYFNLYTTESEYTNLGLQHAIIETKSWHNDSTNFFVSYTNPWFTRGNGTGCGSSCSIFSYRNSQGEANTERGSRTFISFN